MSFEFPKLEHYSNPKLTMNKSFLRRLKKIKEEKDNLFGKLWGIQKQCEPFSNPAELNTIFKGKKYTFGKHIRTIFSNSDKRFPENVFKKEISRGQCEACMHTRDLEKVHIIKKHVFRRPYSEWSFLRYHPVNILFLCRECHDRLDARRNNNDSDKELLKKTKFKRLQKVLNKRIKRISKELKSDEKYLNQYKGHIDHFNSEKKKMLNRLLTHL